MNKLFISLCVLFMTSHLCWSTAEAGRVLFVFADVWSHWLQSVNVAANLKDNYGHHVTFLMPEKFIPKLKSHGFTEENVIIRGDSRAESIADDMLQTMVCSQGSGLQNVLDIHALINLARNSSKVGCRILLQNTRVLNLLLAKRFDLVIVDFMQAFNGCFDILAYKLGVPFVKLGSAYLQSSMGIPFFPSMTPTIPYLAGDSMSFVERLVNFLMAIYLIVVPMETVEDDLVREVAPEKPYIAVHKLMAQTQMYLINQNPIMDFPKPSMPNVQFVGGLTASEPKPLPVFLQTFMDTALGGVVVVSFGSIAKKVIHSRLKIILKTCRRMDKLKFVVKYGDSEKLDGNVLLLPWLPQNDVLGHRNTKLLVTHCGNNGQYEALYHGVPMLGLPLFGDQHGRLRLFFP